MEGCVSEPRNIGRVNSMEVALLVELANAFLLVNVVSHPVEGQGRACQGNDGGVFDSHAVHEAEHLFEDASLSVVLGDVAVDHAHQDAAELHAELPRDGA